jgi:hypothetical protein
MVAARAAVFKHLNKVFIYRIIFYLVYWTTGEECFTGLMLCPAHLLAIAETWLLPLKYR